MDIEYSGSFPNPRELFSWVKKSILGDVPIHSDDSKAWGSDGRPTWIGADIHLRDFAMKGSRDPLPSDESTMLDPEVIQRASCLSRELTEIEATCDSSHASGVTCPFKNAIYYHC
jgi:hypothetical protein